MFWFSKHREKYSNNFSSLHWKVRVFIRSYEPSFKTSPQLIKLDDIQDSVTVGNRRKLLIVYSVATTLNSRSASQLMSEAEIFQIPNWVTLV